MIDTPVLVMSWNSGNVYIKRRFHIFKNCEIQYWIYTVKPFQFKLISQAYEVLSDPIKRTIYDKGGEEAIKRSRPRFEIEVLSPLDIFGMFFNAGRKAGTRGKDMVMPIRVSLEEFYSGGTRKMCLRRQVVCANCDGKLHLILLAHLSQPKAHWWVYRIGSSPSSVDYRLSSVVHTL